MTLMLLVCGYGWPVGMPGLWVWLACGHGWPMDMPGLWHCISEPQGEALGGQGCSKNPSVTRWAAKG